MNSSLIATAWVDFFHLLKNRWKSYLLYLIFYLGTVGLHVLLTKYIISPLLQISYTLFLIVQIPEFLAYILLIFLFSFAVIRSLNDDRGDNSLKAFFSRGYSRYWKTLGAIILVVLTVFLILGIDILLLFVLYQYVNATLALLAGVISVLLLLYYGVQIFFVSYRIILESESAFAGFSSSMDLVNGKWWRTIGSILFVPWSALGAAIFLFLILAVIGIVVSLPFGLFSLIFYGIQSGASLLELARPSATYALGFIGIITVAGSVLLSMVILSFGFLALYRSIKKAK